MAIQLQTSEKDITRIVQAVIQLVFGRHDAHGRVTLNTGATSTVVSHPNCSVDCEPMLQPYNAAAAAEVGNGTCYVDETSIQNGSFTIVHANAGTTRIFGYTVTGG